MSNYIQNQKLLEIVEDEINNLELNSEIRKRTIDTDGDYCFFNLDTDKEIENLCKRLLEHPEVQAIHKDNNVIDEIFNDRTYYSDEYAVCDGCGGIFQMPQYDYNYYKEGELVVVNDDPVWLCTECIRNNYKEEYLEERMNNPKHWVRIFSVEEMKKFGWEPCSKECENGLYGTAVDPEKIYDIHRKLLEDDVNLIFVRTDENPFAVNFVLMKKEKEN